MLVHLAKIFDFIADNLPDREAILWGKRVLTFRDLQQRSHRAGNAILAWGFGCHRERAQLQPWESGQDHVALYMYNCNEYLEAAYGAYFARAVPINVNYRYVADELIYVLENSAARAVIYHGSLAPRLREIRGRLPKLEHFVQVDDGSGEPLLEGAIEYETWLAAQSTTLPALPYSPDDLYILYTGGTTGLPKGVVWRHEDVYYNGLGGHLPGFPRIESDEMLRDHINAGLGGRPVVCSPFMHGAGHWTSFNTFHRGGTVVLPDEARRLDPHSVWEAVQRHKVDAIGLIGDSFALPLLQALREKTYDTSTIRIVVSTAAVLSASVRKDLLSYLPDGVMVIESVGASEAGLQAMSYDTQSKYAGIPAYDLREGTVLLNHERSGVLDRATAKTGADGDVGWIATGGHLPLGYLGDQDKTLATFPIIGGTRYCVGGDRACFSEEGRVLFLGRESSCINSGGEKIYVEEVERVVKSHPAIVDTLVVGVPSARWGQQVTAVVTVAPGRDVPSVADLRSHCSGHLADYKIPRAIVVATEIVRSPSGKPDYAWAKQFAAEASRSA